MSDEVKPVFTEDKIKEALEKEQIENGFYIIEVNNGSVTVKEVTKRAGQIAFDGWECIDCALHR